ncbi:hypothetical protein QAD02_018362 [Eretmocerus hayati]|uniref:Uncharacterized protein n=1 Tax=Eretmocerus hayati TaxID=131215 RepID=A0ACC2PG58_9HYME|nr:hypothetical protein QAD02_018362 [Eretmocerus hayati]
MDYGDKDTQNGFNWQSTLRIQQREEGGARTPHAMRHQTKSNESMSVPFSVLVRPNRRLLEESSGHLSYMTDTTKQLVIKYRGWDPIEIPTEKVLNRRDLTYLTSSIMQRTNQNQNSVTVCTGTSGAGKTDTIYGNGLELSPQSLVGKYGSELFASKQVQTREWTVRLRMVEFRTLHTSWDLLENNFIPRIHSKTADGIMMIHGALKAVQTYKQLVSMVVKGTKARLQCENSEHGQSSRGFVEIDIICEDKERVAHGLFIYDLAGQEKDQRAPSQSKSEPIGKGRASQQLCEKTTKVIRTLNCEIQSLFKDGVTGNLDVAHRWSGSVVSSIAISLTIAGHVDLVFCLLDGRDDQQTTEIMSFMKTMNGTNQLTFKASPPLMTKFDPPKGGVCSLRTRKLREDQVIFPSGGLSLATKTQAAEQGGDQDSLNKEIIALKIAIKYLEGAIEEEKNSEADMEFDEQLVSDLAEIEAIEEDVKELSESKKRMEKAVEEAELELEQTKEACDLLEEEIAAIKRMSRTVIEELEIARRRQMRGRGRNYK